MAKSFTVMILTKKPKKATLQKIKEKAIANLIKKKWTGWFGWGIGLSFIYN